MASSSLVLNLLFLLFLSTTTTHASKTTISLQTHLSSLNNSICNSTPYPDSCYHSLKLSLSLNLTPTILTIILQSINTALSQGSILSNLFLNPNLIEKQRGTLQDCQELHQITLSSLQRSLTTLNSLDSRKLTNAKAFLSAALTNKYTCLEGLDSAYGPSKSLLLDSLTNTYAYVSNSLSILSNPFVPNVRTNNKNRRLLGFPKWLSDTKRRILQDLGDEYDPDEVITVAADGSGNFTLVQDAIDFVPNNSMDRSIIYVKEGVYEENVEIPSWKTNVVLLGDGSDVTVITGSRSVAGGWTTFKTATVAVSGDGFLARDITFENAAGPENHQAVALRINADLAAIYRCTINGYQDTLYVHSFRQFYRECDIYGTIDYIFGNAAVVFQGCNIISKMPMQGQGTVITAQGRDSLIEETGISLQNCSILATDELYSNSSTVENYLGRPWRNYSRTVIMESYIDDFIQPEGWSKWEGDQGLDTLYYGEYENSGPGSSTGDRVNWTGYHVMDYSDASNFTIAEFITGEEWLDSTSFPYDDGV